MKRNDCLYFGYPKRNDFFKKEDILRNGNRNGNEKWFPLSLPEMRQNSFHCVKEVLKIFIYFCRPVNRYLNGELEQSFSKY